MRILLMEGRGLMRSGLRLLLQHLGNTVACECAGARECLQAIQDTTVDLVLVVAQPGEDGDLALMRQLARQYPDLPVLVLGPVADLRGVKASLSAGAQGYLATSATPEDMRLAIQTVAQGGCYLHPLVARPVLAQLRKQLTGGWDGLSLREIALVSSLAAGASNAQIAIQLHVSLGTVKNGLRCLYKKLDITDRAELVVEARKRAQTDLLIIDRG